LGSGHLSGASAAAAGAGSSPGSPAHRTQRGLRPIVVSSGVGVQTLSSGRLVMAGSPLSQGQQHQRQQAPSSLLPSGRTSVGSGGGSNGGGGAQGAQTPPLLAGTNSMPRSPSSNLLSSQALSNLPQGLPLVQALNTQGTASDGSAQYGSSFVLGTGANFLLGTEAAMTASSDIQLLATNSETLQPLASSPPNGPSSKASSQGTSTGAVAGGQASSVDSFASSHKLLAPAASPNDSMCNTTDSQYPTRHAVALLHQHMMQHHHAASAAPSCAAPSAAAAATTAAPTAVPKAAAPAAGHYQQAPHSPGGSSMGAGSHSGCGQQTLLQAQALLAGQALAQHSSSSIGPLEGPHQQQQAVQAGSTGSGSGVPLADAPSDHNAAAAAAGRYTAPAEAVGPPPASLRPRGSIDVGVLAVQQHKLVLVPADAPACVPTDVVGHIAGVPVYVAAAQAPGLRAVQAPQTGARAASIDCGSLMPPHFRMNLSQPPLAQRLQQRSMAQQQQGAWVSHQEGEAADVIGGMAGVDAANGRMSAAPQEYQQMPLWCADPGDCLAGLPPGQPRPSLSLGPGLAAGRGSNNVTHMSSSTMTGSVTVSSTWVGGQSMTTDSLAHSSSHASLAHHTAGAQGSGIISNAHAAAEAGASSSLPPGLAMAATRPAANPAATLPAAVPVAPHIAALRGKRVLLVEDNLINQTVARKMLAGLGLQCEVASNGLEAVTAVEKACSGITSGGAGGSSGISYDVILMDMMMPVMGGVDATRAIRALGVATPILAMTANASDKDKDECQAAGMDGFLSKPVLKDRLADAISKVLVGSTWAVAAQPLPPPPQ